MLQHKYNFYFFELKGTGFSSNQCENEVYINKQSCATQSSSTTQITCKLGVNSGLIPNVAYPIEILVKNQGFAVQNSFYKINFLPSITSLSTNQGSVEGGTLLTINGDGFSISQTYVIIDLSQYSILNANAQIANTNITLTTQKDQSGSFEIRAFVNGVAAVCSTNCNFTFDPTLTPSVTSVSPTSLATPNTVFTISGTSFGTDMSKVHVTIGQVTCQVTSVVDTSIVCTLANLNLGSQNVNVQIDGSYFEFKDSQ